MEGSTAVWQKIRLKDQSACGYAGMGRQPRGAKRNDGGGARDREQREGAFQSAWFFSNFWTLHAGLKVGVCEVGIGASFGEEYFNCHEFL